MSNMLLMPTLKFGDPVQIFILVETDNLSRQTLRLALRFHLVTFWLNKLLSPFSGNLPTSSRILSLTSVGAGLKHTSKALKLPLRFIL